MKYQIKSYIKFLRNSTNEHGVHSPFVYDFLTKCVYDKTQFSAYTELKQYRKELSESKEVISVTDFGAGSRVFSSDERLVSAIAKTAGITKKRQQLLYRIAKYFQPTQALELGTSLGIASVALASGAPSSKVVTVEGCPSTWTVATSMFQKFQKKNIHAQQETFEEFFKKDAIDTYDLVFIDGNHNKERTLGYFELLLKYIHNDTVLIFDDIYWSAEMTKAWEQIRTHSRVTVSIDSFQWGFVFFRKEQHKEHFTLRM